MVDKVLVRKESNYLEHLGHHNQEKKRKLLEFADSVLENPKFKMTFDYLMTKCNLSREEVLENFLEYNLDINLPLGNQIYETLSNRVVLHIHNLLNGSWHIQRQKTVLEFLKKITPKTVADIGFGIPSQYIEEYILKEKNTQLTLCDAYDAAFYFASTLLDFWDSSWKNIINFRKTDMDTLEYIGSYDTYLFLDSIEHALQPTRYLHKYVNLSSRNSTFLLSLPVGPLFSRHNISWNTDKEAEQWLSSCGLNIELKQNVYVNPDVDLFAEELGRDYHDMIVLCSKKIGFK